MFVQFNSACKVLIGSRLPIPPQEMGVVIEFWNLIKFSSHLPRGNYIINRYPQIDPTVHIGSMDNAQIILMNHLSQRNSVGSTSYCANASREKYIPLQWRHNEHDGVTHDCLLNRIFKAQIKENIKAPCHWPYDSLVTGEFPAQMASNAKNVSI